MTIFGTSRKKQNVGDRLGRERTTIIVTYIGFRLSWSSNVELILSSNQVVGEMKDIIYKCYRYRAELSMLRFPAV